MSFWKGAEPPIIEVIGVTQYTQYEEPRTAIIYLKDGGLKNLSFIGHWSLSQIKRWDTASWLQS